MDDAAVMACLMLRQLFFFLDYENVKSGVRFEEFQRCGESDDAAANNDYIVLHYRFKNLAEASQLWSTFRELPGS